MRTLKVGNAVLCEHVVTAGSGKHTLVNAFAGDIVMSDMPGAMTVGVYIEVLPQEPMPSTLHVEMLIDKVVVMSVDVNGSGHTPGEPAVLALAVLPIEVREPCTFRITLSAEGYKRVDAIRKNFRLPSPSA